MSERIETKTEETIKGKRIINFKKEQERKEKERKKYERKGN